jgi:hypothetical protein
LLEEGAIDFSKMLLPTNSYDKMTDYPVFTNVMSDITSKHSLNNGDPRWIQFFSMKILIDLVCKPEMLLDYCHRWCLNNPTTKSFLQFLEHLTSRLSYISRKQHKNAVTPSTLLLEESCLGLYIATAFLQYIISNCEVSEVLSI